MSTFENGQYWTQSWVDPVQAGWWLVLDGSEWPCAVLDVRIVIDEYPGVAVCLVN